MTAVEYDFEHEFDFYKSGLAHRGKPGTRPEVKSDHIPSGIYRWKRKNGRRCGVFIWRDRKNGSLRFRVDGNDINLNDPDNQQILDDNIQWITSEIIPESYYYAFLQSGCTAWPDENATAAVERAAARDPKAAPVFQHPIETYDGVLERWSKYKLEVEAMISKGAATDQVSADIAADLRNVLINLEKEAERQHKVEKEPHKKICDELDKRYLKDLKTPAEALKKRLFDTVINPFLLRVKRQQEEEQAAKVAAMQQENTPIPASLTAPIKVTAGKVGSKAVPREVWEAKITDLAAFREHTKDHPEILAALQRIADDGVKERKPYPGVVYERREIG